MPAPPTPAPGSTGPDSGGIGGMLGGLGGSLGKLFSGKSAMGAFLGVIVALLFGFDNPMVIMGMGLLGAASTSGVMGDLFSGAKNLFSGLTSGGKSGDQQLQSPA